MGTKGVLARHQFSKWVRIPPPSPCTRFTDLPAVDLGPANWVGCLKLELQSPSRYQARRALALKIDPTFQVANC